MPPNGTALLTWTTNINGHSVVVTYVLPFVGTNVVHDVQIDGIPFRTILQNNPPQYRGRFCIRTTWIQPTETLLKSVCELHRLGNFTLWWCLADFVYNTIGEDWLGHFRNGELLKAEDVWIWALATTKRIEEQTGTRIHKGTSYHFLAQTVFEKGDLDTSFQLFFNAVEEDKQTSKLTGQLSSHRTAPAFMFVTAQNNPNNSMYAYVNIMRERLENELAEFRNRTGSLLDYSTFERKFLRKVALKEISFFFVFKMQQLIHYEKMIPKELRKNEFAALRHLEIFFGLALVVDKVLKYRYNRNSRGYLPLGTNVMRILADKLSINVNADTFKRGLNLNIDSDAIRTVVSAIVNGRLTYQGNRASILIQSMVLTWYLRNTSSHNIKSAISTITWFDKILSNILFSLFFAVDSLRR